MRIALFTDYFPPHVDGGVERVVVQLARGYARRGHDVRVFTLNTREAPCFEVLSPNLRVYRAPAVQLSSILKVQSSVSTKLYGLANDELHESTADVIHAHTSFFYSSLVAAALSKRHNTPMVTTLHVGSLGEMPLRTRMMAGLYERTLGSLIMAQSKTVVAVSHAVADHAEHAGVNPNKLTVIANGVDIDEYSPAFYKGADRLRVTCVGRLIGNKGPHHLLEAVPALLGVMPESEVVFVGDGPMLQTLQARAKALEVAHNVTFLGSRDDVADILRDSDVFVRPSLTEGMPLAVLEAMACGLPVIATAVGGTGEVIHHLDNGLLVSPCDVPGLARALIDLATDEQLRQRLGSNARHSVEQDYSWERVIEANLDIYDEVVGLPERVLEPLPDFVTPTRRAA
jgi:glycosyltransferase involved in cell wall biosynthesis